MSEITIMKRKKRFSIKWYVLLLAAAFFMPEGIKAEMADCTVSIPVIVEMSGSAPEDTEFEVILTGENQDTPMPEQSIGTIRGNEKFYFGPISYTVPGDYHYTVKQKAGNALSFTYDTSIYEVTVRVINQEHGGLEAEIWACRQGESEKQDAIRFMNKYQATEKVNVPSTSHKKISTMAVTASPKTGDENRLGWWYGLLILAVCAGAGVLCHTKHDAHLAASMPRRT